MQPALAYLARRKPVDGWLERADGLAWVEISALQARAGLTANLLEIGAYRGRSAILLGYLRQPGERLFVCDTFDDQPVLAPESGGRWVDGKRSYPELTQKTFEDNFARFHAEAPVVLRCPSTALRAAGLVAGPLRMVHVDGCFEPEVLAHDLETARDLLAPGGVVVVEDDHSMHNPGVAPGALAAIDAGDFRPLCMTPWKLYLTRGADVAGLRAGLTDWAAASGEVRGVTRSYRGHETLLLYPVSRRGPGRALDRKAGLARRNAMTPIYKIMTRTLWTEAQARGELEGAPIDLKDGYIHFSTAEQARETAAKHFRGQADLVIACVDGDKLGVPLKWEPSRGGALFPHLYGRMPVSAVVWVKDLLSDADGNHVFPPLA